MAEPGEDVVAQAVEPRHIGDGVYASFDGYHIRLAVNHHENSVVALEPAVLGELYAYAAGINKAYGVRHFPVPAND